MHVLLIHQAFVGPNEAGGTRHFEFAKRLLKKNDVMSIVASSISYHSGKKASENRSLVYDEVLEGIKVTRTYTLDAVHRSFGWRILAFLSFSVSSVVGAMRTKDVDVVMGTSPPIFQAGSALLVAKLKRRPFLLEIRDLWPDFAVEMGVLKNKPVIYAARWFERFLYRNAAHIIVNSPAYYDILVAEKGVPTDKISLIANGVDPKMFKPKARGLKFRHEFGVLPGDFVIVYAGALGMANDISTILAAARKVSDNKKIRFLIVGDGKDRKKLEDESSMLGLSNLVFTGARAKPEMCEVLAAADACVVCLQDIPLFRTTYPNKVFDYMAAARPILLGIEGVIQEVVMKADAGICFAPGNSDALAEGIRTLAADRASAKKMGTRGRAHVVEHFNRDVQSEHFRDLAYEMVKP
ncbi:MAG: glycosyltransferase family 4 protein [Deltaproteobacteria bacterium]|nr:glycosyltransferase family 4 protein [Deltaproteobacteria bacterium]